MPNSSLGFCYCSFSLTKIQPSWKHSTRILSCFSHVQLLATPRTVAHQALLSKGFSRQEYWSGLPCPSPGDLPDPGINPSSCTAGGFLPTSHQGSPESIVPAFKFFSNIPVITQKKVPRISGTCLNRTTQPYCSSREVLCLMDGFKNSASLRNLLVGSRRKVSHWLTQKNIYCCFKWMVTLSRNLRDSLFRTQMISAVFLLLSLQWVLQLQAPLTFTHDPQPERKSNKSSHRSLGWVFVAEIGQVSGSDWLTLGKGPSAGDRGGGHSNPKLLGQEGRQNGLRAKLWWGNMDTVEQNQPTATCGTASTSAFQVICYYFP